MRYENVFLEAIGYELAPVVITTAELEERLLPVYARLGLPPNQIEPLTGILERRQWLPGQRLAPVASRAAQSALAQAPGVRPTDIGAVIYAGVCRDLQEPATACAVAHELGVPEAAEVCDFSNACLGVLNGIIHAANAIELGQIRAAMVVSAESSRDIMEDTLRLLENGADIDTFRKSFATMTGGSGAAAVLVAHRSLSRGRRQLLGGAIRTAPEHHELCRWGSRDGILGVGPQFMLTDAAAVLQHGVALGVRTWRALMDELGWPAAPPAKTVCHQVGAVHRQTVLQAIGVPLENDFTSYEFLGNMGTVSLPLTAALAEERGFLADDDRVALCGIGSGLNCLCVGLAW